MVKGGRACDGGASPPARTGIAKSGLSQFLVPGGAGVQVYRRRWDCVPIYVE
jgi:hypothetical protein